MQPDARRKEVTERPWPPLKADHRRKLCRTCPFHGAHTKVAQNLPRSRGYVCVETQKKRQDPEQNTRTPRRVRYFSGADGNERLCAGDGNATPRRLSTAPRTARHRTALPLATKRRFLPRHPPAASPTTLATKRNTTPKRVHAPSGA